MITIAAAALKALEASTTAEKVSITHQASKAWFDGDTISLNSIKPPHNAPDGQANQY